MNRKMLDEEKLFIARFDDKAEEASKKCMMTSTGFMDMHCRSLVKNRRIPADIKAVFYAPGEDDERCIAVFLPEYIDASCYEELKNYFKENKSEDPVRLLRVEKDRFSPEISHRDYLGALMGLGIKRETTGDIKVDKEGCTVACLEKNAGFIKDNLTKAGRAGLTVKEVDYYEMSDSAAKSGVPLSFTVSSLRLDSVVKNGFNLSRGDAVKLIEQGLVFLNDVECLKPDKKIIENDKIVLRHRGRFIVGDCSKITKKGRIAVEVVAFK